MERRRLKIIPNGFGEKPVLNLMFGALIRAAERWRGLRFTEFELRQIAAVRKELDQEYGGTDHAAGKVIPAPGFQQIGALTPSEGTALSVWLSVDGRFTAFLIDREGPELLTAKAPTSSAKLRYLLPGPSNLPALLTTAEPQTKPASGNSSPRRSATRTRAAPTPTRRGNFWPLRERRGRLDYRCAAVARCGIHRTARHRCGRHGGTRRRRRR